IKDNAMTTIESYYDQLAPFHRYIFHDWEESIARQAKILDAVIQESFSSGRRVLDAACGIGTQSLGLAQLGYDVTASDISQFAIERARAEAAKRKLTIQFATADMRELTSVHQGLFDVVIACDNAIPHLLSNEGILQAFQQFYQLTTAEGGCILSVRDYANMERSGGRQLYPRQTHVTAAGRVILCDLWEFDGNYY